MYRHQNNIFRSLLEALPKRRFKAITDKHSSDKHMSFKTWDHLVSMLFCQFSGRRSLRDVVRSLNSFTQHFYHLGLRSAIKRSTLSDANSKRDYRVFVDIFNYLLSSCHNDLKVKDQEVIRLLDSTTMQLNKERYNWAKFRRNKHGVKLHMLYDPNSLLPEYFEITPARRSDLKAGLSIPLENGATYVFDKAYTKYSWWYELHQQGSYFVTRMKKEAVYQVIANNKCVGDGVLKDQVIRLTQRRGNNFKAKLRRIEFLPGESEAPLIFVTNDLKRSAQEIAQLYKKRWQIELFFKWIKQNLKIKKFIGNSENAVKVQVITALIAYLLIRLTANKFQTEIPLQALAQLIQMHLFTRDNFCFLIVPVPKITITKDPSQNQITFNF